MSRKLMHYDARQKIYLERYVLTALRATPDLEVDGIYNAARSHLRNADEGVIHQMQTYIWLLQAERVRRQNEVPITLSVIALVVSAC